MQIKDIIFIGVEPWLTVLIGDIVLFNHTLEKLSFCLAYDGVNKLNECMCVGVFSMCAMCRFEKIS